MLKTIGVRSIDDLFSPIPAEYRLNARPESPAPDGGVGNRRLVQAALATRMATATLSFLGAGAYIHYRPVVIDSLV